MDEMITGKTIDTISRGDTFLREEFLWPIAPTSDTLSLSEISRTEKALSASEIFSSTSTLNPQIIPHSNETISLLENSAQSWVLSIAVLLLLGYYIYLIYRYRSSIAPIFRVSPSLTKTLMVYEVQNNEQAKLDTHSLLTLILTLTTLFSTYATLLSNKVTPEIAILVTLIAISLIFVYKYVVVSICRLFSDDKSGFDYMKIINRHSITITALTYTPIAIAAATSHNINKPILITLLILWIYYIIRLFGIFIRSGFGKLQWILYLCAVEMLPVSFFLTLAARYYSV